MPLAAVSHSATIRCNFGYPDFQATKDKTHLQLTGTMATTEDAKMKTVGTIPPAPNNKKWKKRPWSDPEFLRWLRQDREIGHFDDRMLHFFRAPLHLKADLPLPDYPKTEFSYDLYHVEQLQDICNKATGIYGTNSNTWGVELYEYIFGQLHFSCSFAPF